MPIEGNLELGTVKILFYKTRAGWKSAVFFRAAESSKANPTAWPYPAVGINGRNDDHGPKGVTTQVLHIEYLAGATTIYRGWRQLKQAFRGRF